MTFSLKPHQLVAHWVPGFVLFAILFQADAQNNHACFNKIAPHLDGATALLAIVVICFVVGLLLDAVRDIGEWLLDKVPHFEIEWDFILEVESEKLQRIEDFYFTYYVFNANIVLALLIGLAIDYLFPVRHSWCEWWIIVISSIVFALNAFTLRWEIVKKSAILLNEAIKNKNE